MQNLGLLSQNLIDRLRKNIAEQLLWIYAN